MTDMIEQLLKKYFHEYISDINERKLRVWQRVSKEIRVEAPVFDIADELSSSGHSVFGFGWMPLAASLVLVVFGTGIVVSYQDSLPGSKLYNLKLAVEDAKLKLSDDAKKPEKQLAIIEKRVEEVVKLEQKAASDGHVSETEIAKIEEAKIEVGKKVIALVASQETATTEQPIEKKDTDQSATNTQKQQVTLVVAADAKVVGEAVTNLLKSTVKIEKLEDLEAVVKQAQVEEAQPEVEGASDKPGATAPSGTGTGATAKPSKSEPVKSGSSVITGDVESEEVEIK